MTQRPPGRSLGLRVDVDTLRGTQQGVPALLETLAEHNIKASFFFSVGPDNMGRHLWRLLRPHFLYKMFRSKAANLYGWDILLRGTLGRGPEIGKRCAALMQRTLAQGHEVGLHAWDHHRWQSRAAHWTKQEAYHDVKKGLEVLESILGQRVSCTAAAGWTCTEQVLSAKQAFDLSYNSDCRGQSLFRPLVDGQPATIQIPVTMPTYDELIGRRGVTDQNYNLHQLARIATATLNTLTVHAEVEGIAKLSLFRDFLKLLSATDVCVVPLGSFLKTKDEPPTASVANAPIAGRDGLVCQQDCGVMQ